MPAVSSWARCPCEESEQSPAGSRARPSLLPPPGRVQKRQAPSCVIFPSLQGPSSPPPRFRNQPEALQSFSRS